MALALSLMGGLVLLVLGAELLVRGAVRLAERLGVSALLIGLTVVGFGTSTPELVTSVQAALVDSPGIAVGNIVGSNIFNILVILGVAAMIYPLTVSSTALRRDGVLVIATALLLVVVGWTWMLDRPVGALLLGLLAAYLFFAWRQERVAAGGHTAAFEKAEALEGLDPGTTPGADGSRSALGWALPLLMALGGLGLLVLGARFFVGASIDLARLLGVSETVIGLTIVAAGTSMPELATSAIAAVRRQSDVAVGNILGSNIYNILGIGGVTALIAPTPVPPEIAGFDSLVMIGVSVLLLLLLWTGRRLTRGEGALLLGGYVLYVWAIWPH
ncbi:calcium/sodium antiporter [Rubellimicrobium roseum]|uniref:Calcium/sodium antiporter n=1 Tax=Rubellimicrobium roseum TaxID=687525 RepID=A0A5C4N651_9RHOB|nr:calcium/sodium antiporter [Rubellimicrobium roseum]TNC65800.1 calcium/sodium antiporter [Rubellimicrobium roseum]